MKLLVLGNSDTSGAMSRGKTWTAGLAAELGPHLATEVEVREIRFGVMAPSAPAYAERKAREVEPDIVILPVGTFPFTIGFVWKRIEARLGKRAGRWYKRLEDGFDSRTRGRGALRDRANAVARRVVRRMVGTQPLGTRAEVTEAYANVIHALARVESVQVLCVAYGMRGGHHFRSDTSIRERHAFVADIERIAHEHHFAFADGKEAYEGISLETATTTPDGFHQNEYGHRILAEFVASRLVQMASAPA